MLSLSFLEDRIYLYHELGGAIHSAMSEPFLSHPNGDGTLWDLEKNDWV